MSDFQYELIKICSRAGKEYYHVYPQEPMAFLSQDFGNMNVINSHAKFSVISFPDCHVTVFASGRMLIENLPQNAEKRAREIIKEIISHSHQ